MPSSQRLPSRPGARWSLPPLEYRWVVVIVYVFALFMEFLDATIINVALPTIATDFGVSPTDIEWVTTAYLLSLAVFIPVSGWAGDRFGSKRTFVVALALFTFGSALCGLAWNVESLVGFRILQGMGGGLLAPVGAAMVYRAFPPDQRARVSSIVTIPTVVGPTSGPVLGGYLVEYQTWHWVFLINVPVGLLGLVIAARGLREHREAGAGRLDLAGFALSATGLAAVIYALAEAGPRGFTDGRVMTAGLGGLAALAAFVAVELRVADPLIDVRLFRDRLFAACNAVLFFNQAVFVGLIFLLPILLQAERGLSPFGAGLATFPTALGVVMVAPLTARLYAAVGPRRLLFAGMVMIVLAALALRRIGPDTGVWEIRALMLPIGWGFGLTLVPLQAASFARISTAATGRASAAFGVTRQVAGSFGVALLATVLSGRLADRGASLGDPRTSGAAVAAFGDAFAVAALVGLVGVGVALLVSDRLAAGSRGLPEPSRPAATVPTPADLAAD
ncbi:MAG: Uncharacterized MFS-type transporter [uncultured Thermomicrobiales bacterium]|uniref:Uncharacterized MFS-type transporter n=1 Tax=uncultured Thermomicrobiales bacterium TaxID=1645740 RepID=A0A6J4U1H3_9BACT|nr:MAG: Uncharacterized MFS-type transporter [uncultured Thermomicrobiales bacterium]